MGVWGSPHKFNGRPIQTRMGVNSIDHGAARRNVLGNWSAVRTSRARALAGSYCIVAGCLVQARPQRKNKTERRTERKKTPELEPNTPERVKINVCDYDHTFMFSVQCSRSKENG